MDMPGDVPGMRPGGGGGGGEEYQPEEHSGHSSHFEKLEAAILLHSANKKQLTWDEYKAKHGQAIQDSLGDADEREMVRYRKELDDARAARLSVGRNHKKKGKKGKKDKKGGGLLACLCCPFICVVGWTGATLRRLLCCITLGKFGSCGFKGSSSKKKSKASKGGKRMSGHV